MQKILLSILACFWLVACAGVNSETTVPDPPDAQLYQVLGTSSLPAVMEAYDMNMHAMLRAKGYRVTEETVKVRVLRPLNDVAQSYDQAAIDNGWSIDDPLPARENRILRTYRLGTRVLIITMLAEANSRDGVVVMRLGADR